MCLGLCLALTLAAAPAAPSPAPPWVSDGVDVQATIAALTPAQKVGQLLLLGFGGTRMDDAIGAFLDEMQPGGVALFTRNITGPAQAMTLIEGLRAHDPRVTCAADPYCAPSIPLFVAVDQEGGNVVRLKQDAVILPSAMALGAADDVDLARAVGAALGKDLVLWGFNMNLAPVLDVSSNPKNPVIGVRSFGGDPDRVGAIGTAYIQGLTDSGVVAVAKHFPGHGDTDTDSHYALPVLHHDRERLFSVELRPFSQAFSFGLPAIMTAHIALPLIAEGKDVPATVSGKVLTGMLRDELGYDGLVITDGLEMQGVIEKYGAGEAAVRAVVAGADMVMVLWFPEKKREVQQALSDAVRSGRISEERLHQAVRRVLEHKARAGLFTRHPSSVSARTAALKRADRSALREVTERAITIVRNDDDVLPLRADQGPVVAAAPLAAFLQPFRAAGHTTVALPWAPTKEGAHKDVERLVSAATKAKAKTVVVGLYAPEHIGFVQRVQARLKGTRVVVVSFGSPWLLNAFPSAHATACSFGWRDESAAAAAAVVLGALPARGRLPVQLAGGAVVADAMDAAP